MPNSVTRDILRQRTAEVIEASLEMCSSARENMARSETIVFLTRETIASSIALLSRVKHTALSPLPLAAELQDEPGELMSFAVGSPVVRLALPSS